MTADAQLPPEVQAAWASQNPRPAARPDLNLERIVAASLKIADADGLSAVSMSRVAKELGFATMALYRHVGSKDELLVHLLDAAVDDPPRDLSERGGWRQGLTTWTRELLAAYLRRSWALAIPISAPPMMPKSLQWMDSAMSIMADTPLMPLEKLSTIQLLGGYARSEATLIAAIGEAGQAQSAAHDYEAGLRQLVGPDRFPAVHAVVATGQLFQAPAETPPDRADDFIFDYGLDRILDGIQALISRRDAGQ